MPIALPWNQLTCPFTSLTLHRFISLFISTCQSSKHTYTATHLFFDRPVAGLFGNSHLHFFFFFSLSLTVIPQLSVSTLYTIKIRFPRIFSCHVFCLCSIPHLWPNSHKIDTSNLVLCFGSAQHRFFNSSIIFHLIALWFVPVQLARSDWVVLLCSPRVLLVLNGRNLDA